MRTAHRSPLSAIAVLVGLLGSLSVPQAALSAPPGQAITAGLQERFGLNDQQVRGALGALLVFAREKMSKPDFDDFARRIPNAEYAMQEVKQRGVVTRPLDTVDEYEEALVVLGIGQPMASQFAPAVLEYLQAAGFTRERDTLAGILR